MTSEAPSSLESASPPPSGRGLLIVRTLAPPLVVGLATSASMLVHDDLRKKIVGILMLLVVILMIINLIQVSRQIVTKPAQPPLGMPRIASGALLFILLGLLQSVLFGTSFFGGCACLRSLGFTIGSF